jgi:hypothetical protein
VLDQITALNTTTSGPHPVDVGDAPRQLGADPGAGRVGDDRHPQLQAAFANIYQTMDAIDSFKVQALDTMATTIGVLENEVTKSRAYLERANRANPNVSMGSLDLGR